MNSKYWYYLFFADLLAELVAIAAGWQGLQWYTKPLLMILLAAWFITASKDFSPLRYTLAAAFFFSWLGDVFLMMEARGAVWFIAGLASFLLAHVLYILFFIKLRRRQLIQQPLNVFAITIVAAYALALFIFLYPSVGSLKIPVGIYALTIASMLIAAVHAFGKAHPVAARYCITGAALFLASDSLLALNKFYHAFELAGILVMLSYGLAQFAITKGSLQYLAEVYSAEK